ncbi:hypothetical protein CAEBREN_04189 [Caenorhabditis brenneri]|uniref:Uncharacterized protein n=1 Tax=Caenorhabditis brenneri TaxID=135651 RepID=G0P2Z7_CAEBE|nr:hypothetical protein CAEBREN_04189 [Caenorhabditis brenneri]
MDYFRFQTCKSTISIFSVQKFFDSDEFQFFRSYNHIRIHTFTQFIFSHFMAYHHFIYIYIYIYKLTLCIVTSYFIYGSGHQWIIFSFKPVSYNCGVFFSYITF